MANRTVKQGDTWPPLKGRAADQAGPLALASASSIKVLMKSGATLIQGTVTVITPPDVEGNNWQYTWAAGDTAILGLYAVELEITWDAAAVPPRVESVPNSATGDTLTIVDDLN